MVVVDEVSRRTMEAADRSKMEGMVVMPTVVPDPPEAGGVKAVQETRRGMLILSQERPQGARVLEETCRFGENHIRIQADRTNKSAAIALH